MRPVLRPGLRSTVVDGRPVLADAATVIPLGRAAHRVVAAVDGLRDADEVLAAALHGCPADLTQEAVRQAWQRLVSHGVLVDLDAHLARLRELTSGAGRPGDADVTGSLDDLLAAADAEDRWRARRGFMVDVRGAGVLAAPITRGLAGAGIDATTATTQARRRPTPAQRRTPDLVVLTSDHEPTLGATDRLLREDVPHLLAGLRDSAAVVGPLVVPGSTPCLRCLDLQRAQADPTWRWRRAMLASPVVHPLTGAAVSPQVREIAAALAVAEAVRFAEGRSTRTMAGTITVAADDPLPCRDEVPPHPWCGCVWPESDDATGIFAG